MFLFLLWKGKKHELHDHHHEKTLGKEVQVEEIMSSKHVGGQEHVPFSLKPFKHHGTKRF